MLDRAAYLVRSCAGPPVGDYGIHNYFLGRVRSSWTGRLRNDRAGRGRERGKAQSVGWLCDLVMHWQLQVILRER